jgi:large subunit ribosomal protein L19
MDVNSIIESKPNPNIPSFGPGDTVKVTAKLKEGAQERLYSFQGIVIRIRKGGAGANFTIRRSIYGIGVEHTFLFHSPLLEKVEVVQQARVHRAKLYYLRGLSSREIRAKIKPKFKTKGS